MVQVASDSYVDVGSPQKAPQRPERLFLGVCLDDDTARRVERLGRGFCADHHIAGNPRPRGLLHISLHFIGDYARLPSAIIYGVRRASQSVVLPPFEVTLNRIQSIEIVPPRHGKPGKHALALLAESAPLAELHRTLGSALRDWGLRVDENFTANVTLLYGANVVLKQSIEPIRFTVDAFTFSHSEKGRSRHNTLGRWSLRDPVTLS